MFRVYRHFNLIISSISLIVPCQSRLFANDKEDNEMIPGAVHRSPDIYYQAVEETPGNLG